MTKKLVWLGFLVVWVGGVAAQQTGQVSIEDGLLQYRTFGEGPPLLIINGGPGLASHHFATVAESLHVGRQVILFDQRGTGGSVLSARTSETITLAKMVADIEALRVQLGHADWVVMGHSWGGMMAMLYAAAHPSRVRGLILSASGGLDLTFANGLGAKIRDRLTAEEQVVHDRLMAQAMRTTDLEEARQLRAQATAPAYVYHRVHIPNVLAGLTTPGAFSSDANRLVWQDLQRTQYDLHAAMRAFPQPTLILHGADDFLGNEIADDMAATFPQAERHTFAQCSHYPWHDQPGAYFATIRAFWEQVQRV